MSGLFEGLVKYPYLQQRNFPLELDSLSLHFPLLSVLTRVAFRKDNMLISYTFYTTTTQQMCSQVSGRRVVEFVQFKTQRVYNKNRDRFTKVFA